MTSYKKLFAAIMLAAPIAVVAGCSSDDNRTVTKEEAAAADVKRQSFIDGLKIPESQKAAMKAHMGGPPVANPADAAREKAGGANSSRR